MNVGQVMKQRVRSCRRDDTLNAAAEIMWENDCGCIPVLDDDGRVIGVVTDRDVCMAAYTQGGQLWALKIASAMSPELHTCKAEDSLAEAEETMRTKQVRRLPVVDEEGRLVGILSLNDIANQAGPAKRGRKKGDVTLAEVGETLKAICKPREVVSVATGSVRSGAVPRRRGVAATAGTPAGPGPSRPPAVA